MKTSACLLFLLLTTSACSSMYYATMESFGMQKRHILVDRVEEARDDQEEAKEQFKTTLQRFKELSNFDGGDLEDTYEELNAHYEECVEKAETVTERIDSIEEVSEDMIAEWQEELDEFDNPDYRRDSEKQMKATELQAKKMVAAMRAAEYGMRPVLKAFKDEVLRLKHALNTKAIASLQGNVLEIENDVNALILEMERSIAEANEFIENMNSPQ